MFLYQITAWKIHTWDGTNAHDSVINTVIILDIHSTLWLGFMKSVSSSEVIYCINSFKHIILKWSSSNEPPFWRRSLQRKFQACRKVDFHRGWIFTEQQRLKLTYAIKPKWAARAPTCEDFTDSQPPSMLKLKARSSKYVHAYFVIVFLQDI